ncbi:alpha/beta-hydrolase [Ophiobolus disseminans]|uniref:Alpha/beta-hydrolase n=1 Tax=Ophiobolus disseminans TaxID=1469910 RepID=A0A6A6ZDY9_9PLEO|nr:alpha/beta-hydrolase [Ophiobolus disseminans]
MAHIRPFTVSIPEERLTELAWKLEHTSFPQAMDDISWESGTPLPDVVRLVEYWRTKFDWRRVEQEINKLPNFETSIEVNGFDPIDIHFLHQPSVVKGAIPLIFVHGWPGSFLEVTKLIPLLVDVEKTSGPAFHIKAGFGMKQYAETCHKLMLALGYDQYVSQGGDWGFVITRAMAQLYPSSLRAMHLNVVPSPPPSPSSPFAFAAFLFRHVLNLYSPAETAGLARTKELQKLGMGYHNVQSTRPQTVGYLLADSPAGLLAWIYEKLHYWSDEYQWTDDEICTWVSMYWFSRAGPAASVRTYYESLRGDVVLGLGGYLPGVKLGLTYFPKEIVRLPVAWGPTLGEVVYAHEYPHGGHFVAWERPESIAGDLRVMFGRGGGAYGVVEGRAGYD